jgi:hypothetical protein
MIIPVVGMYRQTVEDIIPDEVKQKESTSTTAPPVKLQFGRYSVSHLPDHSIRVILFSERLA